MCVKLSMCFLESSKHGAASFDCNKLSDASDLSVFKAFLIKADFF